VPRIEDRELRPEGSRLVRFLNLVFPSVGTGRDLPPRD
jgi:hypothetical protein